MKRSIQYLLTYYPSRNVRTTSLVATSAGQGERQVETSLSQSVNVKQCPLTAIADNSATQEHQGRDTSKYLNPRGDIADQLINTRPHPYYRRSGFIRQWLTNGCPPSSHPLPSTVLDHVGTVDKLHPSLYEEEET